MGDFDDDLHLYAVRQRIIHEPTHEGASLARNDALSPEILTLDGRLLGAEGVGLRVDDQDERLFFEFEDLDASVIATESTTTRT